MDQTVTTFDITSSLSPNQNSGLIILHCKIYRNFSTSPSMNSFQFKQGDFLYEHASIDKAYFYVSLLHEGVQMIDASRILGSLIRISEELTSFPYYSTLKNVTLYLSLHICEFASTMTEEESIQESFNIAPATQRPAFENSIYSLEKEMFVGEGNGVDKSDITCMICLESYIKYQTLLCIPCGHKFCEKCLVSWLRINGVCPLCRYCLP